MAILQRINKTAKHTVSSVGDMSARVGAESVNERKRETAANHRIKQLRVVHAVSEQVHSNRAPEKSVISPGPTRIFIKYEL
jgi:hypothetical protein